VAAPCRTKTLNRRNMWHIRHSKRGGECGEVDLVIGQLTGALYQRHATVSGKRMRGSKAPTISEFLETHAGKSASWCRRCYKAYTMLRADDWDNWDCTGSTEGIIKAGTESERPAKGQACQQGATTARCLG
jgi:hypothetical protein